MFPPCYYHSWLMQIYFNASALHILYIISRISRAIDLQIYSENFRRFPCRFPVVSDGFWRFPVVILGYPWLSLVIFGYLWLSLVILGYTWLSTIQIYVKSFAKRKGSQHSPNIYNLNRRIHMHYMHCFIH